ncbi:translation factor GTPase family protein [Lachnospiraceae bacterium CLA-AA-H185]|uniref:Translation factor GTPase family protein n=1 Tax=Maccoyibacter intestinihominis TaxID=3133499 RepID=A0ABV1H9U6_9FIRM
MGKIVVGILAHVDAGKTTLSEGMLYTSGAIRTMGRVDNWDAFLDTYALERERGITIFSKQAVFPLGTTQVTLLDTPGHVDFSPEMERTLQVLDYAILVISGADGVQGHTRTLWNLLRRYEIPTFVFVNKMDQKGTDAEVLLQELKNVLEEGCVDFSAKRDVHFYEEAAVCSEDALEEFLEIGRLKKETLQELFLERQLFPCFFGSALRLEGVKEFVEQMQELIKVPAYPETFGAKVFKIARDEAGNRLTYLKITGGSLKVKAVIEGQKVNQIRIYSGEKYEAVNEVEAGSICAVTGLSDTYPGEGLGAEQGTYLPVLEPVLNYQVIPTEGDDPILLLPKLRELEEEEPQLHIVWEEALQEIHVQLMGEVQLEVLKTLIYERFGAEVEFGQGNILYKETIQNTVEGVGHFEPLRHYAEVHLLLEPGEPGSGVQCMSVCSEDLLDRNWQRLILTHLMETEHRGVLTGAPITDIRITLVSGKAHLKHTEGGDFRQAVYRAVRQGLKQADSVLLEPYYEYRLELPSENVGRAMTDIERMHGTFGLPQTEADRTILTGMAPVSTMRDYQKEVHAYTRGNGTLQCTLKGYAPCHNTEEVLAATGYDSERDTLHPTGSVFCAHGAGFLVPWYEVKEYMHLPSIMQEKPSDSSEEKQTAYRVSKETDAWIDTEEVDRIIAQSVGANKKQKTLPKKKVPEYYKSTSKPKKQEVREEYLLVDGYNVIFAWEDLKDLAQVSIDGARGKLLDVLCDYQGMKKCNLIVVFDAYRVQGHKTEISTYHNIHVVFTKEAETADQYIEKFAHENGKKYNVTVATSDGLEQIIIRGQGCRLLSARELKDEIERTKKTLFEEHPQESKKLSLSLKDML